MKKSTGTKRTASANESSRSSRAKRPVGYVVCIDNRGYPASLERGKVYPILAGGSISGARPGWLRVVAESGADYPFPAKRFVPLALPPRAKRALSVLAR